MNIIHILQGSNEGDRCYYLTISAKIIQESIGIIIKSSSIYESEPWGFVANKKFLNRVIIVETTYSPNEVLEKIQNIETTLDRTRHQDGKYHSRTIDLDILFVEQQIIQTKNLKVPHPELHKRRFTLIPLAEVSSSFIHPELNKTIIELLNTCPDHSVVEIFNPK